MNSYKKLAFFNKEGDNLNFIFNELNDRFEGDMLFFENSTDTFKTIGIYTLERLDAFNYEASTLNIRKYQLFNEFGFDFYSGNNDKYVITNIEPVNTSSEFYSKWIYGDNFDYLFPKGCLIRFNEKIGEFNNPNKLYFVISNKPNACMILSSQDNQSFNGLFKFDKDNDYTISKANVIGLYDYIRKEKNDSIIHYNSEWNEQNINEYLYEKKKLCITNTKENDGVYTLNNLLIKDNEYYRYSISIDDIIKDKPLYVEVKYLTYLPLLQTATIEIKDNYINFINNTPSKKLCKSFLEIKLDGIENYYTIGNIPEFNNVNSTYYYGDVVSYNGNYYQCITYYTPKDSNGNNIVDENGLDVIIDYYEQNGNNIYNNPEIDSENWTKNITHLPISESSGDIEASYHQIYQTTNYFLFEQEYLDDARSTMLGFVEQFENDFKNIDVECYFEDDTIFFDLKYPNKYCSFESNYEIESEINGETVIDTKSIITETLIYERLLGVTEELTSEMNYDFSENYQYEIVFTDIDEYGFKIQLDKQLYEINPVIDYENSTIILSNTIHNTLLAWKLKYEDELKRNGIKISLSSTELLYQNEQKYDTLILSTYYPNIRLVLDEVYVGTTADYYIKHSKITFNTETKKDLNIRINSDEFTIKFNGSIQQTLQDFEDEYYDYFYNKNIIINANHDELILNTHDADIVIRVQLPNLKEHIDYTLTKYQPGNLGCLITGNEIIIDKSKQEVNDYFTSYNFSTGMILSINNTYYNSQNVKYNILYLDDDHINLSYEGAFFGLINESEDDDYGEPFNDGFYKGGEIIPIDEYDDIIDDSYTNLENVVPNDINYAYGTLSKDYQPHKTIWLSVKESVRRPRENNEGEPIVEYYWKWERDDRPEYFMYDFSGDQLPTGDALSYIGEKPLKAIALNRFPNNDLTKVNRSEYQQTIFDRISYKLSFINDYDDWNSVPKPLELFVGYQYDTDGYTSNNLLLYQHEDVTLKYYSDSLNNLILSFKHVEDKDDIHGEIIINTESEYDFLYKNLKEGQLLNIKIKDNTNSKNQYISINNGITVKIRSIYYKYLIVDYIDGTVFYDESTVIKNYPVENDITYLNVDLVVADKNIAKVKVIGQTEEEDLRFKIELNNIGKLIDPLQIFIFKEYDILEGGTDFTYINKKRKELLLSKHEIFPYIGSYKAIINTINYFGYNDLELNEYFRCVDLSSEHYGKLFKERIPRIFTNDEDGFLESDFILNNFPNKNYKETNLFNLTYKITDREGNILNNYSIDEVIIKLQGLKYYLQRNIIPLTHKILDITGETFLNQQYHIDHTFYKTNIINIYQNMSPITFDLNEAYLIPIYSGSDVYNCVLEFNLITDDIIYTGFKKDIPEYYTIDIKTYKSYKEYNPYLTYNQGDKAYYYGNIYECLENNVKAIVPNRYENTNTWDSTKSYSFTETVKYKNLVYVFIDTINSSTIGKNPAEDIGHWTMVSKWKKVNLECVQTIKEVRKSSVLTPFNFTIDANIDPFVSITVTSDNGYGLIYGDRKNYEISSIKNLNKYSRYIDPIGEFNPKYYK